MTKHLDVYFDLGSPASYLAWTQLPALAQRQSVALNWKPMLLGGVFKATGNQSPAAIPAKGRYMQVELKRFANEYGVEFNFNPYFPVDTLMLMRGAVAHLDDPRFQDYLSTAFRALWVERKDMNDPQVVADVLKQGGFDPEAVLARCQEPSVKEALKALTEEAVNRGVFGAPTFFVGDEIFFGQDRLGQVESALGNQ